MYYKIKPGGIRTGLPLLQHHFSKSTELPNRQPFRQLITERLGIPTFSNRKSLFDRKQYCV